MYDVGHEYNASKPELTRAYDNQGGVDKESCFASMGDKRKDCKADIFSQRNAVLYLNGTPAISPECAETGSSRRKLAERTHLVGIS